MIYEKLKECRKFRGKVTWLGRALPSCSVVIRGRYAFFMSKHSSEAPGPDSGVPAISTHPRQSRSKNHPMRLSHDDGDALFCL